MAKKKPKIEGIVETGNEVKRTNQVYMSLKTIGHLDEKGKSIFSLGYGGRIVAPPDRGLGLLIILADELARFLDYSSPEAAEKDLEFLKKYVNQLKIKKD